MLLYAEWPTYYYQIRKGPQLYQKSVRDGWQEILNTMKTSNLSTTTSMTTNGHNAKIRNYQGLVSACSKYYSKIWYSWTRHLQFLMRQAFKWVLHQQQRLLLVLIILSVAYELFNQRIENVWQLLNQSMHLAGFYHQWLSFLERFINPHGFKISHLTGLLEWATMDGQMIIWDPKDFKRSLKSTLRRVQ